LTPTRKTYPTPQTRTQYIATRTPTPISYSSYPINIPEPLDLQVSSVSPENASHDEIANNAEQHNVPAADLVEDEIPLATSGRADKTWSLVNLFLSLAGTALALFAINKKTAEKYQKKTIKKEDNIRKDMQSSWKNLFFATVLILAAVAIMLFVFTQNIKTVVSLVDMWTPVHAAILTTELLSYTLAFWKKKSQPRHI